MSRPRWAVTTAPGGEFGARKVGLPVLMFARELAAVLLPGAHRNQLPGSLVDAGQQAVTEATLTAAGCPARPVDAVWRPTRAGGLHGGPEVDRR